MAWDTKLTIALISGSAAMQALEQAAKDKIIFSDLGPIFATQWWNYAPAALVFVAFVVWLIGRLSHSKPRKPLLRPLIEAFEMHAAKEHVLSGMCGSNMATAGNAIDTSERDYLKGLLSRLTDAVENLGLAATARTARGAIEHFNTNLNVGTAYAQFRGVTQSLLGEIDQSPSNPAPFHRWLRWAVVVAAVVFVVFLFVAPGGGNMYALNDDQKLKLESALDAWPTKFRVAIFYNQHNEPSAEHAQALLKIFTSKDWPAFLDRTAYVGADVFGISVNTSNTESKTPLPEAKALKFFLDSAGITSNWGTEDTLPVGAVGLKIGKPPR